MAFSNTAQSRTPDNLAAATAGRDSQARNRREVPLRGLWSLVALSLLCVPLLACTNSKKPAVKPPPVPTKPPNPTDTNTKATKVTPKNSTQPIDLPGDQEVEVFSWQEPTDDSGGLADCTGAYASDGSFAFVCFPYKVSCDDGTTSDIDLYEYFDAGQKAGAMAMVGSDVCGEGEVVIACQLDSSGNVDDNSCGPGQITADGKILVNQ